MRLRTWHPVFASFLVVALALGGSSIRADEPVETRDYTALSLEELTQLRVTTVSRTESTVAQSPAAVFVITQEMIRHSGATVLPEVLRLAPGLDVARIDGNKWAVGVRGFNDRFNGKLLVQVDGRTTYNPLAAGVFWDAVDYPLADIDRIEVIRGPGASVWGANAVNGIINIITSPASQTRGLLVDIGGGTEERGFGTVRYGGHGGHADYRVYGRAFTRPGEYGPAGDPNDGWSGGSAGARADFRRGEHDTLTLQGDFIHSEAGRKDLRPTVDAPFRLTNVETETTQSGNVLGRWSRKPADDSGWTLQAYWDHFRREGDRGFVDLRWDTFDLDFQHESAVGPRQHLVWGLGYRFIDAFLGPSTGDGGFAVSFTPADRQRQLASAFVQDRIDLAPRRLSVTVGSKLEHNDFTGFEVQPSARLLWTPSPRHSAWAAVSRALRTPTLSEDDIGTRQLTSSTAPPIVFPRLTGNHDFESEVTIAYESGYRVELRRGLSVDAAVFYDTYDGLRVAVAGARVPGVAGTFDLPLAFQNRMTGRTYGAELAATFQPRHSWRIYGAYSYLHMRLTADASLPAATRASAESPQGQSPAHQVFLQSSLDVSRHVQLDLIGRYVAALVGFNPSGPVGNRIADYTSLDLRLALRPRPDVEITVVGQNLLDSHHPETGTAQFLRSSPVEIRRGVYGSVTVRR